MKRDQEESVKVLAEGRKLLAKGDWEAHQRAAYHAQKLHGPYQFYEMGDRPDKLLADAQVSAQPAAQARCGRRQARREEAGLETGDAAAVSARAGQTAGDSACRGADAQRSGDAAQPGREQTLREARLALKNGDVAKAKSLTDQVAAMKVMYAPHDDCPALVYEEIDKCSRKPVGPTVSEPVIKRSRRNRRLKQRRRPDTSCSPKAGLQNAGRLIEAQQRCLQAQASGATFGPNDDDPVRAVQEIASMAQHQVDTLAIQATDLAHYGKGDPLDALSAGRSNAARIAALRASFRL